MSLPNDSIDRVIAFLIALGLFWLLLMLLANILLLTMNLPKMDDIIAKQSRQGRYLISRVATRKKVFGDIETALDYWVIPHQLICLMYLKHKAKR
jgi:hypothetical protein